MKTVEYIFFDIPLKVFLNLKIRISLIHIFGLVTYQRLLKQANPRRHKMVIKISEKNRGKNRNGSSINLLQTEVTD